MAFASLSWEDEEQRLLVLGDPSRIHHVRWRHVRWFAPVVLVAVVLVFVVFIGGGRDTVLSKPAIDSTEDLFTSLGFSGGGVNLGGWLCLEDWFFSGSEGRMVNSPSWMPQGHCLPPRLEHAEPWPSEGLLTFRLNKSEGEQYTSSVIDAYRRSFLLEEDFEQMASLGIRSIRLPITWAAFADALSPLDDDIYGSHDPEEDTVIVPDPFYHDQVAWATIPRILLKEFLQQAGKHGFKVLLDLHSFPGGSQSGTYNGVFPLSPVFWTAQTRIKPSADVLLRDTGRWIVHGLIRWIEALDADLKSVISGLTPMNEPGHGNLWGHFAPEWEMMAWLESVSDLFRNSTLPGHGIKLYVNFDDSAWHNFYGTVPAWFMKAFSQEERKTWVVADRHYYMAWDGACNGKTVEGASFGCFEKLSIVQQHLHGCATPAMNEFRQHFGSGLLAVTEWSLATFPEAAMACTNKDLLHAFLREELAAFGSDVEYFFWTWKMPYGPNFESGWSLKCLAGYENTSDIQLCSATAPAFTDACADDGANCRNAGCCKSPGMTCFEKDRYYSRCMKTCKPGVNPADPRKFQTPWSCKSRGENYTESI
mmetsp:Transcript_23095/g.41729  ORF Transcript_23095/g.41729 Transcript_23095/m.41729 type:complete len:590 (-) Transcript_23095:181-1950(-)